MQAEEEIPVDPPLSADLFPDDLHSTHCGKVKVGKLAHPVPSPSWYHREKVHLVRPYGTVCTKREGEKERQQPSPDDSQDERGDVTSRQFSVQ